MYHSDQALRIESHLNDYSQYSKLPNEESRLYFLHQAQEMHALCVLDSARDLILASVISSDLNVPINAQEYLRYGLGRRTRAIWHAFRAFHALIPPDRIIPLSIDQAADASNELNAIYLNIRGALDNFAGCFQNSVGRRALKQNHIGLFNPVFLAQPEMNDLLKLVDEFKTWDRDFKSKRDPAAHRIPLTVVQSIQDESSLGKITLIEKEIEGITARAMKEAESQNYDLSEKLFKEAEQLHERRERIGKFSPLFEYDPAAGPIDVYPNVIEDIGVFIIIARRLFGLLGNTFKRRPIQTVK